MTDLLSRSPIAPSHPPLPKDSVAQRVVGGELVLYNPASQTVHVLNATAALVWQLCDGQTSEQEIVAALTEYYPESAATISADVPIVVEQFREQGLLAPR